MSILKGNNFYILNGRRFGISDENVKILSDYAPWILHENKKYYFAPIMNPMVYPMPSSLPATPDYVAANGDKWYKLGVWTPTMYGSYTFMPGAVFKTPDGLEYPLNEGDEPEVNILCNKVPIAVPVFSIYGTDKYLDDNLFSLNQKDSKSFISAYTAYGGSWDPSIMPMTAQLPDGDRSAMKGAITRTDWTYKAGDSEANIRTETAYQRSHTDISPWFFEPYIYPYYKSICASIMDRDVETGTTRPGLRPFSTKLSRYSTIQSYIVVITGVTFVDNAPI